MVNSLACYHCHERLEESSTLLLHTILLAYPRSKLSHFIVSPLEAATVLVSKHILN